MKIKLRDYQREVLNNIIRSERKGNKRIVLQMATGGGKTICAAALIEYYVSKGNKVLFLAHRRELIMQASDKLDAFNVNHGIIMANISANSFANVQVASIDTLRARALDSQKIPMPEADLIIIDEAHRSLSRTYGRLIKYYSQALVVGLTATPVRSDGTGMGAIYTDMVQAVSIKELVASGNLVEAKYYSPTIPDLRKVGTVAGDYNGKDLATTMDTPKLVGDIVQSWLHIAKGKSTIVFASGVKHSKHLMESFVDAGIIAAHIDGTTPGDERNDILKRFHSGEITVICNCMVLTEGFDAPRAEICVLARPTKSVSLYIQMVGRVLRPFEGKDIATVIDHSGAVYINGFATDDHNWTLGKGKIKEPIRREPGEREVKTVICEGCFRTYEGSNICPTCGLVHKQKSSFMETIDAQLGLVDKVTREVKKKEKYGDGYKQKFYQELLGWTVVKKKQPGAAAHKYKQRFGDWPRFGDVQPLQPSKDTMSYIQHLNIKWARRKR